MWIFAYGSELFEKNFPHLQRVPGCITGYLRRFWMASVDEVGVPTEPGRIVTLIRTDNPKDMVWGAAYEISAENEESVIKQLDFRDKPGFTKHTVTFYPVPSCRAQEIRSVIPFQITVYCPTDDNKLFIKNEPIEKTAVCLATSQGVRGTNAEYLFRLASAVRVIAPRYDDGHLFSLEGVVQYLHSHAEVLQNIFL